jgi:cytochrome c553
VHVIAGRFPNYLVRQRYDMQAGTRPGEWADLMIPAVATLAKEDFVNIAAYVPSACFRHTPTRWKPTETGEG